MFESLARPLTVVAHDAGAANHIFAWLGGEQARLCLAGPAQTLWQLHIKKSMQSQAFEFDSIQRLNFPQTHFEQNELATALIGAATVITGTGWESNLEHDARKIARENGIHTIAVIDHWTNYEDRFIRNGEQIFPDEIWVSDSYAVEIAKSVFPTVRVVQHPNAYLAGLVAEVEFLQLNDSSMGNERVLYVLEPIRHLWGEHDQLGEFLALDYFMENFKHVAISEDAQIRLRPHPSDPIGKYDAWLLRQANPRLTLDRSSSLAEALGWSTVVVGCQTYAMVLAIACGRTVISSIPDWAPPCVLPHMEIIKMGDVCSF